jgi:hypothetical protein
MGEPRTAAPGGARMDEPSAAAPGDARMGDEQEDFAAAAARGARGRAHG